MNTILKEINAQIESLPLNADLNCLCELIMKDNQPHPVDCVTRKQVAPKDTFELVSYFRLLDGSVNESEEDSFGDRIAKKVNQRVVMVIMMKTTLGEDYIYSIINLIPEQLKITGYRLVDLGPEFNLVVDQKGLFEREFGDSGYERHATSWNIYGLEFNISFITC